VNDLSAVCYSNLVSLKTEPVSKQMIIFPKRVGFGNGNCCKNVFFFYSHNCYCKNMVAVLVVIPDTSKN